MIIIKNKNLIFKIIIFFLIIIPINVFAYSKYIIPGGETIGIEVNSKGILVVGFYKVNNKFIAKESGLLEGDVIEKVNDTEVNNINDMLSIINKTNKNIELTINAIIKPYVGEAILPGLNPANTGNPTVPNIA